MKENDPSEGKELDSSPLKELQNTIFDINKAINTEMSTKMLEDYQRNSLIPRVLYNQKGIGRTVEWLSTLGQDTEKDSKNKTFIATSGDKELIIASMIIPEESESPMCNDRLIKIEKKIATNEAVNKARAEPKTPWIIATQTSYKDILIFNIQDYNLSTGPDVVCDPLITLEHHTDGGSALAWSKMNEGSLLSGSYDKTINLWNFNPAFRVIGHISTFDYHSGAVMDIDWMPTDSSLFASVDDQKYLFLWDIRQPSTTPIHQILAHTQATTCVSFNPLIPHLLATASTDGSAGIWDLRQLKNKLYMKVHNIYGHVSEITSLKWSPQDKSVFSVTGGNGNIQLFDLYKSGLESFSSIEESLQRDSLFINEMSTEKIYDHSWHPTVPRLFASVSKNYSSIWQVPNLVWENIKLELENELHGKIQEAFGWDFK